MNDIVNILILLISPFLWAYRDSLAFPSEKDNKAWHRLGFLLRLGLGIGICGITLDLVFYGFYFWVIFEIAINKRIGKDIDYVDNSTDSGRFINKYFKNRTLFFLLKIVILLIIINYKLYTICT